MSNLLAIVSQHFPNHKEIPVDSIQVKDEVRQMCEMNRCGSYNKTWTCPPAIGPLEESVKRFKQFLKLIVLYHVYELTGSFDWRGMQAGGKDFKKRLLTMKKELEGSENFLILGAGGCRLCERCTYASGDPCRNPNDAIISLEAYGIDVMSLMRINSMNYNNGPNTMTLIGGVLYEQHA